jgi:hypothetical protein
MSLSFITVTKTLKYVAAVMILIHAVATMTLDSTVTTIFPITLLIKMSLAHTTERIISDAIVAFVIPFVVLISSPVMRKEHLRNSGVLHRVQHKLFLFGRRLAVIHSRLINLPTTHRFKLSSYVISRPNSGNISKYLNVEVLGGESEVAIQRRDAERPKKFKEGEMHNQMRQKDDDERELAH